MTPDRIVSIVKDTPHTPPRRGRQLYDFILQTPAPRCLELGFAHGVGTVWMAGAAEELNGKVIGVDILSAKERLPAAAQLVAEAGLDRFVELHFDPISYTWHLQRNLDDYAAEPFDFIFIDGAHTWDADGFTFFLCEKVLKPGGWILFDDLDWNYRGSAAAMSNPQVQALTDEEKDLQQVRAVWEKLVLPHPAFGNFTEDDGWGWAQKSLSADAPKVFRVTHTQRLSIADRVVRKLKATF
ncbi:class I SAM-dependent methyltransferase [Phenylobacterium sp.]|jgi:predicted O-methyltransferase YrrM|uniref:O-methyltransferase n=1 Tax=Phenylobacterium sp. TaxID=1871053 RepID=UPI002F4133B5